MKVAMITGGASGIGFATALLFARNNIVPIITGRREKLGLSQLKQLQKVCPKAKFYKMDVSNREQVKEVFSEMHSSFGRLDILVNNAAISGPLNQSFEHYDYKKWLELLSINISGVFNCTQEALKQMKRESCIVNVSSIAGIKAGRAGASYTATKHAINGLTKSLAIEYADKGIRVNSVCPGVIDTDMIVDIKKQKNLTTPMKRYGKTSEVAELILFLCKEQSSFMTGAIIPIDGGVTA